MGAQFRAELLILRKWPAVWALALLGPFLTFFFTYFLGYFEYLSAKSGASVAPPDALLGPILPEQLLASVLGGFALYGSAVAIILGGLAAGGEWGRSTLKLTLTQRPGRLATYAGQTLAIAAVLAFIVLVALAVGAMSSSIIATIEGEAISWPAATEIAQAFAAALLASVTWGSCGVALGVLFRSSALAIGVGLVWITIQGLVETVALQFGGGLEVVYKALPAANTIAVTSVFDETGSPIVDPAVALWVLASYTAAFLALGVVLLLRRDVA